MYPEIISPKLPRVTRAWPSFRKRCNTIVLQWSHMVVPYIHCMMTSSNEKKSPLLALCDGNPQVTGGSQGPVTRSFDVFFDLRLNKRLSKQSRRRWFETPSRSLWRYLNDRGPWFLQNHWSVGVFFVLSYFMWVSLGVCKTTLRLRQILSFYPCFMPNIDMLIFSEETLFFIYCRFSTCCYDLYNSSIPITICIYTEKALLQGKYQNPRTWELLLLARGAEMQSDYENVIKSKHLPR